MPIFSFAIFKMITRDDSAYKEVFILETDLLNKGPRSIYLVHFQASSNNKELKIMYQISLQEP